MDADDRVRDSLPVNAPYDGLIAQAYDCWLPPDGNYDDRAMYQRAIEASDGPALELGCGNGRLLIEYRKQGLDVEGMDNSADMLAICRAHADAAGVEITLHHADWTAFGLPRKYATIYNPAGSFSLIQNDEDARRALTTWMRHLASGGKLCIVMAIPRAEFDAAWEWKVRRSATRALDGVTFMVHEALRCDQGEQAIHALHRHELWDANGDLITTYIRRHRMRWWTGNQLEELLLECGATRVKRLGTDDEFMVIAEAPVTIP
jgi:SAM-dependent methyltransferase